MISNAGDSVKLDALNKNSLDIKEDRQLVLKNVASLLDVDTQKTAALRGALGDKKNTVLFRDVFTHGRLITDKLHLKKEQPKSFNIYCDDNKSVESHDVVVRVEFLELIFLSSLFSVNDEDCKINTLKYETADEQFERVDPDADVEGFTGDDSSNDRCVGFSWDYDFGLDNLVCNTFSKLSRRPQFTNETEVSCDNDQDDTILEEDW
uniref:RNA polymerase II nuclear localization protein SLC7A6OS n=1 Tax=Syphacia muris TaxID=451379 RepID=A0A0N5ALK4_9BILA